MSKENEEYESLFSFYEKAIEGRNQHYQNYSKWMNYYSLFTGAFFIAYYNIFGKNLRCLASSRQSAGNIPFLGIMPGWFHG